MIQEDDKRPSKTAPAKESWPTFDLSAECIDLNKELTASEVERMQDPNGWTRKDLALSAFQLSTTLDEYVKSRDHATNIMEFIENAVDMLDCASTELDYYKIDPHSDSGPKLNLSLQALAIIVQAGFGGSLESVQNDEVSELATKLVEDCKPLSGNKIEIKDIQTADDFTSWLCREAVTSYESQKSPGHPKLERYLAIIAEAASNFDALAQEAGIAFQYETDIQWGLLLDIIEKGIARY